LHVSVLDYDFARWVTNNARRIRRSLKLNAGRQLDVAF
jgi:hypothetical protein